MGAAGCARLRLRRSSRAGSRPGARGDRRPPQQRKRVTVLMDVLTIETLAPGTSAWRRGGNHAEGAETTAFQASSCSSVSVQSLRSPRSAGDEEGSEGHSAQEAGRRRLAEEGWRSRDFGKLAEIRGASKTTLAKARITICQRWIRIRRATSMRGGRQRPEQIFGPVYSSFSERAGQSPISEQTNLDEFRALTSGGGQTIMP